MKSPIRWALAIPAIWLVGLAGTLRAQDASLDLVPAKAPIVIQMNGFENARNRLGKFLGNALPDIAPKLSKQIEDGINEIAEGRELSALSKDERIYFIVTDLANLTDNPQFAILVPVTGYAEFKKTFLKDDERKSIKKDADGFESMTIGGKDEPGYLVDRKNYVVLTNDKDVAKSFAKGDNGGLGKALSKETAKAFLGQDVAVYVNLKEINRQFGAQIKGFKSLIELGLQAGGMGIDKKQIEMIKTAFDAFLQLIDDGVAAVIGFEFRPEGVNLKFVAQFGSETETNTFLKKLKPAALAEIGTLPGGLLGYSVSNFDPKASKTIAMMMKETMANDEDEDAKKAIDAALKELADNGRIIEMTASKVLMSGLEVSEYKDGAKAAAAQMKLFKAMTKTATYQGIPLKEKPVIKENAESVGDLKLSSVKIEYDFDKAVKDAPEATKEATKLAMMKFADEKSTMWFGHSGNKVLHVQAKDWAEAKGIIDDYLQAKNPLEKDESFQTTRKQLPREATILMILDGARFLEAMIGMVKDSLAGFPGFPGGAAIPDLKAPKGKPAYFGMAIVLKAEYASFDLFVPVTAVQQVRKMLAPLIDADN